MTHLDPATIEELERLEREATAGPWEFQDDGEGDSWWNDEAGNKLTDSPLDLEYSDEQLLIALRNAAPQLIAAARRVAELEELATLGEAVVEHEQVMRGTCACKPCLLLRQQRKEAAARTAEAQGGER